VFVDTSQFKQKVTPFSGQDSWAKRMSPGVKLTALGMQQIK